MTNQKLISNVTTRANFSRACVFIDSSNPSMPYQVIDSKIRPLIKLPFPPLIDPTDLVVQQANGGNIPARAPNAFIIYRKAFIDAAHVEGYHLPMRIMSSMASQSWEQESDTVKSEYRRLANEAFNLRNEMYPKSGCRRKRAKWNIVSFKNKNKISKKRQKWNIVSFDSKKSNLSKKESSESKKPVEIPSERIQQIPSPIKSAFPSPISQDEGSEQGIFSNVKDPLPSTDMGSYMSNKVNEISSNNEFNQDFVYQNLIPSLSSPELSINSGFSPQLNDRIDYDLDFGYPEQSLNGTINQNDERFNLQNIVNANFFNYYQSSEIHPTFSCNHENLLNENISSQGYINGSFNFQSTNVETDALHLYDNGNYFSNELGISPAVEYFQY